MTKRVIIIPYKMGSKSGKLLKEGLVTEGVRCFRKSVTDIFIPRREDVIIYYGGTDRLQAREHCTINANRNVAQNKLSTFEAFKAAGLSTVEWTDNREVAIQWYFQNIPFMVRTTLTGHSGQGIIVFDKQPEDYEKFSGDIPQAPLYTKYQKKTYECRVHVFNGKVIDAQVKRKRTTNAEEAQTDPYVRNIHTGWVYCREDYTLPEAAAELAIAAVACLGLDFGAVDLIYNKHHDKFYLLEVNTAAGLEGTTLRNYVNTIKDYIENY